MTVDTSISAINDDAMDTGGHGTESV